MGDWLEMVRKVADMYPSGSAAHIALRTVLELADAGYLIDARRIEALSGGERIVCLSYEPGEPWPWEADGENVVRRGKTAAAALGAAEREEA